MTIILLCKIVSKGSEEIFKWSMLLRLFWRQPSQLLWRKHFICGRLLCHRYNWWLFWYLPSYKLLQGMYYYRSDVKQLLSTYYKYLISYLTFLVFYLEHYHFKLWTSLLPPSHFDQCTYSTNWNAIWNQSPT